MSRGRIPAWGPIWTFALVTLVALALINVAAGVLSRELVSDQVRRGAEDGAVVAGQLGLETELRPSEVADGRSLSDERYSEVDGSVLDSLARSRILRLSAWNANQQLVYSSDPDLVSVPPPLEPELRSSLTGKVSSAVVSEPWTSGESTQVLVVFVPVRAADDAFTTDTAAPVVGSIGVALPYAPLAASVTTGTRQVMLAVGALLLLLYAILLGLVVATSRRLRTQVRANRHQARHDDLTGLPNRVVFREELAATLDCDPPELAVVLLDLDGFKDVNDTLGHRHGDTMLVEVARRVEASAPPGALACRLGGDEFAVLLPGRSDPQAVLEAAHQLLTAVGAPVEVDGLDLEVRASSGVVLAPVDGSTPDELLQRAEVAMYQAKATHSGAARYDASSDGNSPRRLVLAGEVRRAIEQEELIVHYQPKLDLIRREVVGVEALVRWQHPVEGLLPPADFMPVVETTSLIRPLTAFVVDQALAQSRWWRDRGLDLEVSVNLSAGSVHDLDLPSRVQAGLERHDVPARSLVLELTETTLLVDPVRAQAVLEELHALGVRVAIDDFGTGYASLSYLRDLPVDELKIDQSFIRNVVLEGEDAGIVEFSIALARVLGLVVVAEGVEDGAVLGRLTELGCDQAQGFHVARPGPADGIELVVESFARSRGPRPSASA